MYIASLMSSILFDKKALGQALLQREELDGLCLGFLNTLFGLYAPILHNSDEVAQYFENLEEEAAQHYVAQLAAATAKAPIAAQQLLLTYCAEAHTDLGRQLQAELYQLRRSLVED